MRAYANYQNSETEWLGQIPTSWEAVPLKHMADFVNGAAFKPDQWSEQGAPIIRIENLNGGSDFNHFEGAVDERYHVEQGDILFGWSGNRGTSFGPFIWSKPGHFLLNQHIFNVRGFDGDRGWFYWCLKAVTEYVEQQAHGIIGMVHVTKGNLGRIRVPLPPLAEQQAIAAFLDRETTKVDALVEEQRRLIALLKEKRQAVISHAVTRGLDPAAPLKHSGIDWLGDIPAHWEQRPIRKLAKLESGHTPSRSRPEWWQDCYIPWFGLADVWQIRSGDIEYVEETKEKVSDLGLENSSARLLPAGTVILSRTASVGYSAIMKVPMATTQDFANWICGTRLMPDYLLYSLRSMGTEFERLRMGSTHNTIYMPDIASLRIALPSVDEQQAIVEYIRTRISDYDALTAEATRAIALLQERRAALISAAVTGKIDVRNEVSGEEEAA